MVTESRGATSGPEVAAGRGSLKYTESSHESGGTKPVAKPITPVGSTAEAISSATEPQSVGRLEARSKVAPLSMIASWVLVVCDASCFFTQPLVATLLASFLADALRELFNAANPAFSPTVFAVFMDTVIAEEEPRDAMNIATSKAAHSLFRCLFTHPPVPSVQTLS